MSMNKPYRYFLYVSYLQIFLSIILLCLDLFFANLELGVWHEFDSRITSVLSDSFINWMETEYCESDKPNPEKLVKHHLWEISLKYDESMGLEYQW